MRPIVRPLAAACLLLLAACDGNDPAAEDAPPGTVAEVTTAIVPGDTEDTAPFAGIAEDEALRFTGTEPFWGGQVSENVLTYSTPEIPDGTSIEVRRFAGRGGIAFSGLLDGAAFEMMVTPLECSDGMSDRTYPFTATLKIGEETRNGCAWSEVQPFSGPEHP